MVPESMFLIRDPSHIILLTQETVVEEGEHLSNPHNLSYNLLHIVIKQNIHDLWLEGLEVWTNDRHIQLHVAVHVDTRGDLVSDCCCADVCVGAGGREEMVEAREPGGEEAEEETGGLIETMEVMDHHVQVEPESKHLTCKSIHIYSTYTGLTLFLSMCLIVTDYAKRQTKETLCNDACQYTSWVFNQVKLVVVSVDGVHVVVQVIIV